MAAISVAGLVIGSIAGCQNKTDTLVFTPEQAQSTEALKVEDYSVKQDLFYLYLMQYIYNNTLEASEITDTSKQTAIDYTVGELQLEMVEYQLALVTENVTVSEEELAQAKKSAQLFCQTFPEKLLNCYGITMETVEMLFEQQIYVNALTKQTVSDLATDLYAQYEEKYADFVFQSVYYVLFPSVRYDESGNAVTDDEGNVVELSESELKEQEKKAQEVKRRADSGEALEDLAEEYGVAYCSGIERNYSGAYEEKLNEVLASMEEGDISDVVETDAGYMVIRMDNADDTDYKKYWLSYMANDYANNLLPTLQQTWMSAVTISDSDLNQEVVDALDLKKLCEKMEEFGVNIAGN